VLHQSKNGVLNTTSVLIKNSALKSEMPGFLRKKDPNKVIYMIYHRILREKRYFTAYFSLKV